MLPSGLSRRQRRMSPVRGETLFDEGQHSKRTGVYGGGGGGGFVLDERWLRMQETPGLKSIHLGSVRRLNASAFTQMEIKGGGDFESDKGVHTLIDQNLQSTKREQRRGRRAARGPTSGR